MLTISVYKLSNVLYRDNVRKIAHILKEGT